MTSTRIIAAGALIACSAASFAAKPTSIAFQSTGETEDGTAYSEYTVKCSDGRKVQLTAWDNRRRWCVGGADSTVCEKKQIKAAKAACKGD